MSLHTLLLIGVIAAKQVNQTRSSAFDHKTLKMI